MNLKPAALALSLGLALMATLLLMLLPPAQPAAQAAPLRDTPVSGVITQSTTWVITGSPYILNGLVTVQTGVTLTVEPGVTVKGTGNGQLRVHGHLQALGTPQQPITFTSNTDTGPNQWEGIRFDGGAGHLKHATVRYAGIGNGFRQVLIDISDVITGQVLIESSRIVTGTGSSWGVYINNSTVTISDTLFTGIGNSGGEYPVRVKPADLHRVTLLNNTFHNNFVDRVLIDGGGALADNALLEPQPKLEGYTFSGQVTVPEGLTLTVKPGVTMRGGGNGHLRVYGHLEAVGAPQQPITFTSNTDTGPNQWEGIRFDGAQGDTGYGGTGHLKHATIRYAGQANDFHRAIIDIANVLTGQVRIESSRILSGASGTGFEDWGIYLDNSNVTISDTLIQNTGSLNGGDYPVRVSAADLHRLTFTGNTLRDNQRDRVYVAGGALSGPVVLEPQPELESYTFANQVTVPEGFTLTVKPGVAVRGGDGSHLRVYGHLEAVGAPQQPITFTSNSNTGPNEWRGIRFDGAQGDTGYGGTGHLKHATIRYAGQANDFHRAIIDVANVITGQVRIESSRILSGASGTGFEDWGIYLDNSTVTISNTLIQNTGSLNGPDYPVRVTGADLHRLTFSGNILRDNQNDRVYITGGALAGPVTLDTQTEFDGFALAGNTIIPAGITLTVQPGVTVRGETSDSEVRVRGHLEAAGTFTAPITFTASSAVGATQWEGIVVEGGSGYLNYATVERGGNNNAGAASHGNVVVRSVVTNGQVLIENSNIRHSQLSHGLVVEDGTVNVASACIYGNADDGVHAPAGGAPSLTIGNSDIRENSGDGLQNSSGLTVTATFNWWGHPTGPTHPNNPRGAGQPIIDNNDVDYSNFTAKPVCSSLLRLSKKAPGTALVNQPITYTLKATNLSTVTARGLVITDALPAGATLVQALDGGQLVGGDTLSWTVSFLPGQASALVRFVVTATAPIVNSDYVVTAKDSAAVRGVIPVQTTVVKGGSGEFEESEQSLGVGRDTRSVGLADFNGDGYLDIFETNGSPNAVYLNDGEGNFTANQTNLGDGDGQAISLGDLDGNGAVDALVSNGSGGGSEIWLNDGNGNFSSGTDFASADSQAVALGDINGDGALDALVATSGVNQVWLNDGGGNFVLDPSQPFGSDDSQGVALGDLNDDGLLDALVVNGGGQANQVWLNDGTGLFTNTLSFGSDDSRAVALGDLDSNGTLDALVSNNGTTQVWLNDGSGVFGSGGSPNVTLVTGDSRAAALGDLDADGDLDAFIGNGDGAGGGQANQVWLNDGSGNFQQTAQTLGDDDSAGVAIGDLDGDGDLDTVVGNGGGSGAANQVLFNINRQIITLNSDGGLLTDRLRGLTTTLEFPADGVNQPTVLTYTSRTSTTHPFTPGLKFAGRSFSLVAAQGGVPITNPFLLPFTVTMHYDPAVVTDENKAALFYWKESIPEWVDAQTICPAEYDRRPAEDAFALAICHLTDFALVEDDLTSTEGNVYLPVILK